MVFEIEIQMPPLAEGPNPEDVHRWVLDGMKADGLAEPPLLVVNPA